MRSFLCIALSAFWLFAADGLFTVTYSENNTICGEFVSLLNGDIKKNGKIALDKHKEFNFIKYKGEWGEDYKSYTAYFDINNDGVDETFVKNQYKSYQEPNTIMTDYSYESKQEGIPLYMSVKDKKSGLYSIALLEFSTDFHLAGGHGCAENEYSETLPATCAALGTCTIYNTTLYPSYFGGKYYIAAFGKGSRLNVSEDPKPSVMDGGYGILNASTIASLVEINPDNSKDFVCVITRENKR